MLKTQTSNIEILKELKDRGLLRQMVVSGIVPIKVEVQAEMYYSVKAKIETGAKATKAVECTACDFNVSKRTVKRAVEAMK